MAKGWQGHIWCGTQLSEPYIYDLPGRPVQHWYLYIINQHLVLWSKLARERQQNIGC